MTVSSRLLGICYLRISNIVNSKVSSTKLIDFTRLTSRNPAKLLESKILDQLKGIVPRVSWFVFFLNYQISHVHIITFVSCNSKWQNWSRNFIEGFSFTCSLKKINTSGNDCLFSVQFHIICSSFHEILAYYCQIFNIAEFKLWFLSPLI